MTDEVIVAINITFMSFRAKKIRVYVVSLRSSSLLTVSSEFFISVWRPQLVKCLNNVSILTTPIQKYVTSENKFLHL